MTTSSTIYRNFILGSFLALFICFHAVTLTHEVLGHGLAARAFGAKITDIRINWFGGSGRVSWEGGIGSKEEERAVEWAGIVMTLVLSAVTWFLWKFYFRDAIWSGLFFWLLAVSLFTSSFGYIVFGLHHGFGDMRKTSELLRESHLLSVSVWAVILVNSVVLFFAARYLVKLLSKWFPDRSWYFCFFLGIMVFGTAAGALGFLNVVENRIRKDREYQSLKETRARKLAKKSAEKKNMQLRELGRPEMGKQEKKEFITKKQQEYAPYPIGVLYIPILFISSLVGTRSGRKNRPETQRPSRIPVWMWALAALLLTTGKVLSIII